MSMMSELCNCDMSWPNQRDSAFSRQAISVLGDPFTIIIQR